MKQSMDNVSLKVLNALGNNYINNNCNKILKSDWLSTVLSSALIGQCNRKVRIMPNSVQRKSCAIARG